MAKITLDTITSSHASTSLFNTNFSAIQTELNDKVLYRDNPTGEANQMENDLDMNSNDILNTSTVNADVIVLGGVQITPTGTTTLPATDLTYDNTTSGLTATNVQAAIDEVDADLDTVEATLIDNSQNLLQLGTATLSTNTYTFTPLSGNFPTALLTGTVISFTIPTGAITGAASLNYDGATADIRWLDLAALVADDIDTTYNKEITLKYNGTQWVIISTVTGSNSNGEWCRYPDGCQRCTDQDLSKATNDTLTFAKAFSDTLYTVSYATAEDADRIMNAGSASKATTGITKLRIQDTAAAFVTATKLEYTVTGRWY